jgi:light-regulated signal transduction histidine kinase (bacteriophytochrome)
VSSGSALDQCAQEPIRIPGAIQPFGALLLVSLDGTTVLSASVNLAAVTGVAISAGEPLAQPQASEGWKRVLAALSAWRRDDGSMLSLIVKLDGRSLQVTGTQTGQGLLLEFEPLLDDGGEALDVLYPRIRGFMDGLDPAGPSEHMLRRAATELLALTGFDRVLVYRFDADGHGTVVAEDGNGTLPSYLGHRFPASDIPPQARALYVSNRIRLIPDAGYAPVPLAPPFVGAAQEPVDLSAAAWRSVSPIHLEYMRNMGTLASMSVSLVIDGQLWGLISCHSALPHSVGPQIRATSEFVGRIVANQVGANERIVEHAHRIALKTIEVELVEQLSRAESLQEGFGLGSPDWTRLLDAHGAALVWQEDVYTIGTTPDEARIRKLADWLAARDVAQIYSTDHLAAQWPDAHDCADVASGIACISVSRVHNSYLIWFRPEVVRTVQWRGDPNKSANAHGGRLHPRKSFDLWQEQLRSRSTPWRRSEIDTLADFRNVIVNIILKRAEERAELTEQLQRSNVELESFSYSVSHDLRAPFRHIAGFAELLRQREGNLDGTSTHYIENIVRASVTAGRLVDDLLRFSHLGRAALTLQALDMNKLVAEVRQAVELSQPDHVPRWDIGPLPPAVGDQKFIRQVWYNLMENAVKYSGQQAQAVVAIRAASESKFVVYTVSDNGVGFDMAYVGKLFGVFQRLHKHEDFEGTGIGLALSKRIVEKHGGWIKGEGAVDQGARFSFALPQL